MINFQLLLTHRVTTYKTERFPDLSSRANKDSSIYYSTLLSPGAWIYVDRYLQISR